MKVFLYFIVFLSAFLVSDNQALYAAETMQKKLVFDVALDHVDVTAGFTGSTVEVFGTRSDPQADVAIILKGPQKNITVWKKERFMGTWVNRYYVAFKDLPMYYNYGITNPNLMDKNHELMIQHEIGVNGLFEKEGMEKSDSIDDISAYRDSLVVKKRAIGVFPNGSSEIRFLSPILFRTSFTIPPSVPTGDYTVEAFLIKNGKIIEEDSRSLQIAQVGLNAFVLRAAKEHAFFYSLFCIGFAVLSGWIVSIIRVKT